MKENTASPGAALSLKPAVCNIPNTAAFPRVLPSNLSTTAPTSVREAMSEVYEVHQDDNEQETQESSLPTYFIHHNRA